MASRKKPAFTKQRQRKKATLRDRWPLTWAGSLLSSVLIAAVTAAVTVVVTRQTEAATDTAANTRTSGPPVIISTQIQQFHPYFVFPGPIHLASGQLASLNEHGAAADNDTAWFIQHGAAEVNQSYVQLFLTGNVADGVRVTGLTVTPHCTAPLTGTIFANPGGGNQQQAIAMNVDLDAPTLIPRTPSGAPYFAQNTIVLADGEQDPVALDVATTRSSCSYTIQLQVLDGTRPVTESVPGGPFRVTAFARHYDVVYLGEPDAGDYVYTAVNPSRWDPGTMESG